MRSSIFYFLKRVLKNVTNQSSIWNWVVSYLFFSFWCIPSFLLTYLLWVLFLSFQVLYVMYKGIINMMPIQHDLTFLTDLGGQTLLHPLECFWGRWKLFKSLFDKSTFSFLSAMSLRRTSKDLNSSFFIETKSWEKPT